MILIIDNYDSFTFNLVQILGEMAEVIVKKNDEVSLTEIEALAPDGMVISPGPGTPDGAGLTLNIIEKFREKIPLLGVCLGYQAMGVLYGGKLCRAPQLFHGKCSWVYHDGRGILKGVASPFYAMRYHSWAIDPSAMDPSVEIIAWTSEGLPMALQHKNGLLSGVQFHPESILTLEGKKIVKNFINSINEM